MRRVACIALSQIRVEIAREREDRRDAKTPREEDLLSGVLASWRPSPLAVVVARPGGTVKTERDVLGNTRLDVVSREARALGVRERQTVASARAKCAELRVHVIAEESVRAALMRVAELALAFGPTAAFDVAQDIVWVEIGGCAHLHGSERELALALGARVCALGHACRVAIAGGPRIAAAVARFAPTRRVRDNDPLVVPEGKGAAAVRILPVTALALDDDTCRWLADLGLTTCGALQRLPRRSLGTRLGARAHDVMQLLDGEDHAPLDAWRPPEIPEEHVELEWGVSSVEALAFVTKTLCDRLAVRLEGRAMAAARIEFVLVLDRALCRGASHTSTLDVVLPAPIARAADLLAVVRTRLERHSLVAPVLAVTLRAPELARAPARTLDLLSPEAKADRALPRLVAELAADFGGECVGTLAIADTWVPDERTHFLPFGAPRATSRYALVTSGIEPSRLVNPVCMPIESLVGLELLARVEAVEWWRRGVERCDLVAACIASSDGAVAWVELRGLHGDAQLRGWVD
jgi:protein ImuB